MKLEIIEIQTATGTSPPQLGNTTFEPLGVIAFL